MKENNSKEIKSIIQDLDEFKVLSDITVTNRMDNELNDVVDKVYTRDLYGNE